MGLVQAENIQVHAESYDVALDMSFPKGSCVHVFVLSCRQKRYSFGERVRPVKTASPAG